MRGSDSFARRQVVTTVSGAAITGLAGCLHENLMGGPGGHGHGGDDGHATGHDDDGHGHGGHSEAPDEPSPAADVQMTTTDEGEHFEPHVVWVERGGTVTWHLESGEHSTTAYHPENDRPDRIPEGAASWDSGLLSEQGETYEHAFETRGVYDYYCTPHEGAGMIGSVIVGHPDPDTQPALDEPQDTLPDGAREKIRELNESVSDAIRE